MLGQNNKQTNALVPHKCGFCSEYWGQTETEIESQLD